MTSLTIEQRLRRFLLGLATAMTVGTIVELWLAEHTESPTQLLPFLLCALALAALVAAMLRPIRATILALRLIMGLVGLGSFIGVFEHITGNLEFVREIHPDMGLASQLWESLHGGAPLLAPGILGLTAAVAIAATYYHPALGSRSDV